MRILLLAALSLVLGASMIVPVSVAQDPPAEPVKPEFTLRLPAAKPAKQTWKARNVVRNGDFALLHTAWAWTQYGGGVREEAAREPKKDDRGAYLSTDRNNSSAVGLTQTLYMPDKVSAATLTLDWRLFGNADNAALEAFTIAIGASGDDGLEAAATPVLVGAANYPGGEWQKADHRFTADELKTLNDLLRKQLRIIVVVGLSGLDMTAQLDNVALTIDGEFTPPEMPGHLAFVDTTDNGYDLVVTTPGGASRETVFSVTGASHDCRGIDWRPDGKALCFTSDHDFPHSWWAHDFYELTGDGLRRVSNGPSVAEVRASGAATGSVKVLVRNYTGRHQTGGVYVRGGLKTVLFTVGPKGTASETTTVTLDEVADLGEGVSQYVCARIGGETQLALAGVDVVAGKTVDLAGEVAVSSSMSQQRPSRPSYRLGGDKIVYEMGNCHSMDLASGSLEKALGGTFMSWDPACSPADDRVLFVRIDFGIGVHDFKTGKVEQLIKDEATTSFNSPAWISDASGFVYVTSTSDGAGRTSRNIALYGMEAKRSVMITDVQNEHLSQPTLSPDAQWMAVIRQRHAPSGFEVSSKPELWVLKVGAPHIGWRIQTSGAPSHPSWSRR